MMVRLSGIFGLTGQVQIGYSCRRVRLPGTNMESLDWPYDNDLPEKIHTPLTEEMFCCPKGEGETLNCSKF